MCEKGIDFAERFISRGNKKTLSEIIAQTNKSDVEKLQEYYNNLIETETVFKEDKNLFASINMSTQEIVDLIILNGGQITYEYAEKQRKNVATRVLHLLENFENGNIMFYS